MSKIRRDYIPSVLGESTEYKESPVKPDPAEMELIVQSYRDGDVGLRNKIIRYHYRIVVAYAGTFRYRNNQDGILGEALLALVDAVDRAATALTDNNITPYIMAVVKDCVKDFIARDRPVFMPPRTFRDKVSKGEISEGQDLAPIIRGVVSCIRLVESDTMNKEDSSGDYIRLNGHMPYIVPASRPEEPSLEFTEALTLAIHTETERRIIDLRALGYKYRDMETILGLKKSRIGDHVKDVEERFLQAYTG